MAREIYNIASSGLQLAQRGLNTSSNNIANANVEGFSRQRLETSGIPDVEGSGGSGTSGRINGYVQRFNDNFIHSQITSEQSSLKSADTYHRLATRIDNFIADPDTNLLVPMTNMFTGIQNIVTDPTDSAARIDMLDKANVMAQRIGTLNDQLTTIQDQFNSELGTDVDEVNLIARNLAEVNSAIVSLSNNPNAEPPNELLDRRDTLLQNLAEKVNVKVITAEDGTMNVFLGYGQSLVSGESYNKLELQSSVYDKNDKKIMLVAEGQAGAYDLTSSLAGGEIGGLQKFKREVLDPTTNRLGQMAAGFALAFNSQQRQGIDMNGYTGQNVFTDYTNAANTVENWRADTTHNTGTAQLEVTFDDSPDNDYKKLIPTEYNLKYTEENYTITRLSDNKVFSTADGTLNLDTGGNLKLDGLKIKVEGKGTMADGDSFRLRPFSRVADEFKLTTTDPAKLAAASQPNHSWTAGSGNAGSAQLNISFADSPGNNVKNMKPGDYQLKYEKGDFDEFGSYTITRISDNTVFSTLDGTLTPDEDGGFTVDGLKIKIADSETLTNGDTFTIKASSEDFGGIADNSNMIALGQLQTQGSLDNGAYSFHQVYTQLVTSIGGKTRTASIDTQAHETFLKQLTTQRENVSGVNLDEEAANLLKYQQAYQAAAQIIPIANSMFDTLISAVR